MVAFAPVRLAVVTRADRLVEHRCTLAVDRLAQTFKVLGLAEVGGEHECAPAAVLAVRKGDDGRLQGAATALATVPESVHL